MDDKADKAEKRAAGDAGSSSYELTLKGDGLELSRTLNQAEALEVLAILMGTSSGAPARSGAPALSPSGTAIGKSRRGPSLREYFDETEPKRNPDKILVIASYLKETEGVETFAPEDVKGRFRTAGESVPGNWGRDFRWVVQNGWIAEDRSSGDYYVTKKGDEAVANKFSADVKKGTSVKQGSRRRAKKSDG